MIDLHDDPSVHRFDHRAMNTVFSGRIRHDDAALARDAADAAFDTLDRLEDRLSLYRDGSDVCQINAMQADQTLLITQDTHDCLLAAVEAHQITGGLFDITLGTQIQHLKSGHAGPPPPPAGRLHVLPDRPAVRCLTPGRGIDLGGIGKGFALDRMARVLTDWGVDAALLASGASTLLAIGPEPWPVELRGATRSRPLALRRGALSASGTAIQGSHIVHPDRPHRLTGRHRHVWVTASSSALADACSTACMLLDEDDVSALVAACDGLSGGHIERDDGELAAL